MEDLFIKNTNLGKSKIILKFFNQYLSNTIKKLEDDEEVSIIEIKELIKLIVNFKKKTEIKLESLDESDSESEKESTSSLMKLESTEDDSIKSKESDDEESHKEESDKEESDKEESDKEESDKEESDKEESDKEALDKEKTKEIKKPEDPLYLSFINQKPFLKVLSNPNYDIFKNVEKFIRNSFVY